MLLGWFASAWAQALTAVPPGVTAVTVLVCDAGAACAEAERAMAEHCDALGLPLVDFDALVAAGPGGGEARARLDAALAAVAAHPDDGDAWQAAREALPLTPFTLDADVVFRVWLGLGAARLTGADADPAGADLAFAAAAASSDARMWDLGDLPPAALDRYLSLASRPASPGTLEVRADHPAAVVLVDGAPVGSAPVTLDVRAGWHRVSVERPGRRTAWVGEVTVPAGRSVQIVADVGDDDTVASVQAAVVGATHGVAPPRDVGSRLATVGREQGLATIRFVRVEPTPKGGGAAPEERVYALNRSWDVFAAWLDVPSGRFLDRGPGPATLRAAADADRFTLGVQLGYARLQGALPTGPDPHDQLSIELVGVVRLRPALALDVRAGLWRAAQPYYLYADWRAHEVVPVAAGVRWAPGRSGVYLGAHGLVVIPMAVGGEAFAGWAWRPSPRWRVGIEGRGGYTDQGAVFGGGLTAGFSG